MIKFKKYNIFDLSKISMGKVKLLFFFLFLSINVVYSQVDGDWQTLVDGSWSNAGGTVWQKRVGGAWVTQGANQYPGLNAGDLTVTIINGHNIDLDVSPANNINALTINNGAAISDITFIGANSLTVNNATTITGSSNTNYKRIFVNAGAFITGSLSLNSNGDTRDAYIEISTGTATVLGNITMNSTNLRTYIRFTDIGTLFVGGNMTGGGITSTLGGGAAAPTSGTVNYNGGGVQNIGGYTYFNLTVSNTNIKTLAAAIGVNNNLDISGTATLASDIYQITGNATGTFTMAAGTGLTLGNIGSATAVTFPTAFTTVNTILNNTSTVTYQVAGAQNVSGTPAYGNLSIATSGTKTILAAVTVNNNLDISGSAILYTNTFQITGNATGTCTMGAGTGLTLGNTGSATAVLFPTNFIAGNIILNSTSTVTYQSNIAQAVSNIPTYGNLTIATNVTKTLDAGNLTVNGNLSVNAGTFDLGVTATTVNITGTASIAGTLTFNGTSTKTVSIGNNLSGAGTINMSGGSLLHVLNLAGATNAITTFTTAAVASEVNYNGTAQTVFSSANYRTLTISNSGIKTMSGAVTCYNLAISGTATLYTAANAITGNAAGTMTMAAGTGLTLGATATATAVLFPINFVAGNITLNSTSTVTYQANLAQAVSYLPTYGNLTIATNVVKTLGVGNLSVAGDLTVSAGTFNLGTTATTIDITGATAIAGILAFGSSVQQTVSIGGDLSGAGTLNMSGGVSLNHILNLGGANNAITTFTTDADLSVVNYNRAGDQQIFGSANYRTLTLSGSGIKSLQGATTLPYDISIGATITLKTNGQTATTSGNTTIAATGTLDIDAGATYLVANTKSIANSGILKIVGTSGNNAVVSRNAVTGFTIIQAAATATFHANYYNIYYTGGNGVTISDGTIDATNNFSNGTFDFGTGNQYLDLSGLNFADFTANNVIFNTGPLKNVKRTSGAGIITFVAGGTFDGEADDDDDPSDWVHWQTLTFYSLGGNWDAAASWSTAACGGAVAGSFPVAGDNVVICDTKTITLNADAACANLTILGSGILDYPNTFTLTISGDLIMDGTSQIKRQGGGAGTSNFNASTFTVLSTATNVIWARGNFTITGATTIDGIFVFGSSASGSKTFGDITVNPTGTWNNTIGEDPIVYGNILNDGTWLETTGGTSIYYFRKNGTQYIDGNPINMNNIRIYDVCTIINRTTLTVFGNTGIRRDNANGGNFKNGDGTTAAKLYLAGLPPFDAVGRVTLTADAVNNTVYYNDATGGTQNVRIPTGGAGGYYNLVLMNGGTKNFESAGTMSVSNLLTISQATVFNIGTNTLNGTGGLNMTETSELQIAKTGVTIPELSGTYTLNSGTSVTFNGTTAATQTARNVDYWNLNLQGTNNASLMDLGSVITIHGNLSVGTTSGTCVLSSNGAMTVDGAFTYSSSRTSTLTNNIIVGSSSLTAGTLNDGGLKITITGAGGWSKTGGTYTTTGEVEFIGGAAQVIAGTQTTTFNKLTVNKTAGTMLTITATTNAVIVNNISTGKLTMTEGIFDTQTNTVSGTGVFDATGGEYRTAKLTTTQPELGTGSVTGGLVLFNGAGIQSIKGITYYNLEVATTPAGSTATFAADAIVSNNFTVTSGTAAIGANSLTVSGTSSITGIFNITSTTGIKTFNNIVVNLGGNWNCSVAEDIAVNGNIQNDGTLTSGSGIYTLQGASKTISGTSGVTITNPTVTGTYANNTTFTSTALLINNPAVLTNNSITTNVTSIGGTAGGQIVQGSVGTLNIGGTIATITLDASTNINTVIYTSTTADQTIFTPTLSTYHHLTIDKSGRTGILGSDITCNGDFTITLGTFSHSATPYNLTVKGGFSNSGIAALVGTGKVLFNGALAQTIAGSTATTFYDLEISNASGVTLSSSNESVSNVLTLTSGNINTGIYSLIMTSTGTVSRTDGHIDGYFQKYVPTGAPALTYEIGDGALYAPLDIIFASVGTAGTLTSMSTSGNDVNISSSDIDPNKTVRHSWKMINSGIVFTTYSATFNYTGESQSGVTADYSVQRYNAGVWTDVVSVVPTPTTTSTTITTEATLDRDFQIGVKYDPSITYTAVTGTVSWNAAPTWIQNRTGTITTSTLSNVVTGTSTKFWGVDGIQGNADDEIIDGDLIVDQLFPSTVIGIVAAGGVTSPTSLTLTGPAASDNAGISYGRNKIPTSNDIAVIGNPVLGADVTVQVDATPASPVFRMVFIASGNSNTVDHTIASDLQILNNVIINQPSAAAKTNTWKINTGSSTVGGNVIIGSNDADVTRVAKVLITASPGQLNISTNIVFRSPAGSSLPAWLDITGTGTVNLAGAISLLYGTGRFTPSSTSWFNYNRTSGGGGQTVFLTSPIAYTNLKISTTDGTGATLGAAITAANVTEQLWVISGATLHNGGFAMVGAAGKEFKVDGTFEMTGATDFPTGFTVFTLDPLSTVQYHQTDARLVKQTNYGHLLIQPQANSITHTFEAGTTTVFGNITLGDGVKTGITVTALTNASILDIRGNNIISANTTFISSNNATAVSITGNWTNNGTFTPGTGTLIFNNTLATQTIGGTTLTHTFNNITVAKTGSVLLTLSATPTTLTVNDFTLTSGAFTLPVTLATMNINGNLTLTAGTFTASNGGIINSKGDWTNTAATFTPGTGTVEFNNTTTTQNINGANATQTFNNVTVDKTAGILLTFNAATPTSFNVNNFVQTSGNVTVPNTLTSFTINGNLTLTAGIFTAGTGTINSKGNWNNSGGTFTHGSGTVAFNSSSVAQTINGTATFNNLTMNNTFATGKLTLAATITVDGTLTLTNKNIISTAANILYLKGTTTIGSAASFVEGPMKQNNPSGAKTMYYPIGVTGVWRPAVLGMTACDISDDFTVELINSSASALGYTMVAAIDKVSGIRYYNLTQAGAATFTTTLTLYYSTTDGADDEAPIAADLRVAKTIGAGTQWQNLGGTGTAGGTGSITSTPFSTFSKAALANRATGGNPLPVSLINFNATCENGFVNCQWSTLSEMNNDYFNLQKSNDLERWEHVATIKGAGNSNKLLNYNYIDKVADKETIYYKLIQHDFDGNKTSYNAVSANCASIEDFLNIVLYPNPASSVINMIMSASVEDNGHIYIYNDIGNCLFSNDFTISKETIKISVDITNLSTGNYYVKLVFNKLNPSTHKFVHIGR